jgi:hypothetical protein
MRRSDMGLALATLALPTSAAGGDKVEERAPTGALCGAAAAD